jgi:hypothetical protein
VAYLWPWPHHEGEGYTSKVDVLHRHASATAVPLTCACAQAAVHPWCMGLPTMIAGAVAPLVGVNAIFQSGSEWPQKSQNLSRLHKHEAAKWLRTLATPRHLLHCPKIGYKHWPCIVVLHVSPAYLEPAFWSCHLARHCSYTEGARTGTCAAAEVSLSSTQRHASFTDPCMTVPLALVAARAGLDELPTLRQSSLETNPALSGSLQGLG